MSRQHDLPQGYLPQDDLMPIAPADCGALAATSDDECLRLLAVALRQHDAGDLEEVAQLIGRLAVPIE